MPASRRTVRRAAKALDQVKPGWHNQIDTTSLAMMSPRRCILGQIFDGNQAYTRGKNTLERAGFNVDVIGLKPIGTAFLDGRKHWIEEIEARLKKDKGVPTSKKDRLTKAKLTLAACLPAIVGFSLIL